ncbi:redoxin domain-containing protein [Mesobacillus foraminis]|jgi:peroxiredoxin (alkyl hydroperoxide reductase subunit C)|uniref:AhpC/TSA family protein n=1 Tax=Mesobacillus foraminis TaxID=279826 RepID=A0A4R2B864_9BACI|nr:redoxin domain-containing protein [Mesobacillus foraminis]TCN22262.1 AhpC/TSA family protein [Mesobacillus foraminis]
MDEKLHVKTLAAYPAGYCATRDDAAPMFSAEGVVDGNQIREVRLEEYRGQWVILFFYPSDFTPV